MTSELRPYSALGTETCSTHDGAQRPAEVALLALAAGERCQYCTICDRDEFCREMQASALGHAQC